jgi:hypothetical protein
VLADLNQAAAAITVITSAVMHQYFFFKAGTITKDRIHECSTVHFKVALHLTFNNIHNEALSNEDMG